MDAIVVRDVIERNDCSGKKQFFVTCMGEDESIPSVFRLTRAYMFPDEKLLLASISPGDKLKVVIDHVMPDPFIVGEFVGLCSDVNASDPLCRCGTDMVSDGYEVYCPNVDCALTALAKVERLANTVFFDTVSDYFDPEAGVFKQSITFGSENTNIHKPFTVINQGLFWGYPGGSVENVLLEGRHGDVSSATFLVEPIYREFLDQLGPTSLNSYLYLNIEQFFEDMRELINRRDYDSRRQNMLVFGLLSSLGIESLSDPMINAMMAYERQYEHMAESMLVFAYLLTNPSALIHELGLHQAHAMSVFSEVKRRRHELFDIFYHYTNQNADVYELFNRIM